MHPRITTYKEFWPYYLREHSRPGTRRLHLIGTLLGLALAVYLTVRAHYAWIPLALLPGYGFAWFSHFFVEKNRPATFQYPWWSFISDFRMAYWMLTGRLK